MQSTIKICFCFLFLPLLTLFTNQSLYAGQTLTLVSQNMNRFFDDKDDGRHEKIVKRKTYQKRIKKLSEKIITNLARPDILALQEIENLDILEDVAKRLKKEGLHYQAVLMEGNDISGIDVGFLVKKGVHVTEQRQLFKQLKVNSTDYFLFSRPPLLIEACMTECVTIINLHLRSMRGLRNKNEAHRVAKKRKLQAETIAKWVNQFQISYPQHRLVLVGDFNALPVSDNFVDVIGTLRGQPDQTRPKWKSKDLIERDLIDLTQSIPARHRSSYVYKKHKQQLDYLLIGDSDNYKLQKIKFGRIDFKFSDHAPLISVIELLQ
jgi:uncharacterized protein